MRANWGLILLPSFLIAALMLIVPQYVFLQTSLHKDIGVGRFGDVLVFDNYFDAFRDRFYFRSLLTDFWVSIKRTGHRRGMRIPGRLHLGADAVTMGKCDPWGDRRLFIDFGDHQGARPHHHLRCGRTAEPRGRGPWTG